MLFNKLTIALVAGLAAVGEAEHHARRVHRIRSVVRRQYASLAQIAGIIQETAQGIRVVKSFGMEDAMRRRMEDGVLLAQRTANKMAELSNRTSPLMETTRFSLAR